MEIRFIRTITTAAETKAVWIGSKPSAASTIAEEKNKNALDYLPGLPDSQISLGQGYTTYLLDYFVHIDLRSVNKKYITKPEPN